MKSFIAKPAEVERKWYVIDAEGKNLGEKYNKDNNITPTQVVNESRNLLIDQSRYATDEQEDKSKFILQEPVLAKMSPKQLSAAIEQARRNMEQAAKELDFLRAAQFRDEMYELKKLSSKQ